MASVVRRPRGRYWISIGSPDGRKRTLRLGKCSRREADQVRLHVEAIDSSRRLGLPVPDLTMSWISQTNEPLRSRLTRCGLAQAHCSCLLAAIADGAFSGRVLKDSTRVAYATATATLLAHLGADCDVRSVTAADAWAYRDQLRRWGLREATVRRRCGVARDIFSHAVDRRVISVNPFVGIPAAVRGSADRARLVAADDCRRLIDACPDAEWRLMIVLARWGALRVPSELLGLTWSHVDWGDGERPGTVRIKSPKTEHHAGGAGRTIPLFPEIRAALEELFSIRTPSASDHIFADHRGVNPRTMLGRIAIRAGVDLWPKPFVNMRATRDAELRRDFPAHVVRQWVGHSERVAQEHYLIATDESYIRAAVRPSEKKSEAKSEAIRHHQASSDVVNQRTG